MLTDLLSFYGREPELGKNQRRDELQLSSDAAFHYRIQLERPSINGSGKVARDVSATLPKRKLTALIMDESGIAKKGGKSIG